MYRLSKAAGLSALAFALALAAPLPASATQASHSLYSGPGPRPGPDILYQPLATAPQLTNTGIWKAPSILVSGASAYRDGEFMYQDFLDDDHGALEQTDPQDQRTAGNLFSKPDGTYTYPTDPAYANNAADLVEFRVKALPAATAFRVTLNTMRDPKLVAFTIALGGADGASYPYPDGANVSGPADLFLTVHAQGGAMIAQLTQAATGHVPVDGSPTPATVSVDTARNQIEVVLPHGFWNPSGVERMGLGVGLWDAANNAYLLPGVTQSATAPGGSGGAASPPAFFNVGFRTNTQEPMPDPRDVVGSVTKQAWWRDEAQAEALAAGDISAFHADVDFGKLAAGVTDYSGVPASGPFDRILQSHFGTPQSGNDWSVSCFPGSSSYGSNCPEEMQGNLQPYAIYVPQKPEPRSGWGMTLLLHSLSAMYNQYLSTHNQSQFGERGPGSIVITPSGRGPDGFYDSYAGSDTFEVWADVAHHYHLNPDWTVITGYSMGGYGTFKLAEEFPDLFARAQPTVGCNPSAANALVPSLRNVPVLMWNMATDELVPESCYYPTAQALDAAGYRYELHIHTPGEHLTLAINDQFQPAADFLGETLVDRNPAHVTFVVDPAWDYPKLEFVADHAYWVSNIRERDTTQATGKIDVLSEAFGAGDPTASGTQFGAGQLTGGTLPTIAYGSQLQTWGATPAKPRADVLDINATNIGSITIDPARAGVDCNAKLNVTSDGPLKVTLAGCSPASAAHTTAATGVGSQSGSAGAAGSGGAAVRSASRSTSPGVGLANTGLTISAALVGLLLELVGLIALATGWRRRPAG
ncbi:MAG TPA: glucodextranase DOMON-like domain-containing protein [Candidatus Dormibacteraeota bacterium]